MIGLLETREEKLQFLIKKYFKLSQKELADTFEVRETEMSKIVNNQENKLKNIHLLGFCQLYDVPYEIFSDKKLNTEKKLVVFLDNYRKNLKSANNLFQKDERLWEMLKGVWYGYMYASVPFNGDQDIHQIKTDFYGDYEVIDEYKNAGKVFMGDNQSIIVKKTPNEKNFSLIVISNKQVAYQIFRFAIISIQNGTDASEMFNWGFYTKEPLSKEEAREVLDDKKKIQLKLDYDLVSRIRRRIRI